MDSCLNGIGCARLESHSSTSHREGGEITRIGLDLAKNVFQVHGIDRSERVVVRRQLSRSQVVGFFEKLEPCLIGMEAGWTSSFPMIHTGSWAHCF
jgi:transposase